MPINIAMPAVSPSMEEGTLAKWLVKEGDRVASGDVIAEIETDKTTVEIEATEAGTLAKILIEAGTGGVKVDTPIAILHGDREDIGAAAPAKAGDGRLDKPRDLPAPADARPEPQPSATPRSNGRRVRTSPLARRVAKDAGVDIATIEGSGPYGRILRRDVDAALAVSALKRAEEGRAGPAVKPAAMPVRTSAVPEDQILGLFEEGSYELKPHDNLRKTIARRLVAAKSSIPHVYLTADCELDALLALRRQLNAASPMRGSAAGEVPRYKLSVNDMVIKAMGLALVAVPGANVSWTDANMVMHRHADVAVAVAIDGGLVTPIIRKVEQKSLSAISNEMKELAARARDRKLKPEEYQGGTTAVSNLGMFGTRSFSAVINPPHASILAVGAGEQRPIMKDGVVQGATVMSVTLSIDHRAIDGALGAKLLAAFKSCIENPLSMLV